MSGNDYLDRLFRTWRAIAPNYDRAVGVELTRDYLKSLNKKRFEGLLWKTALAERKEEFPAFFEQHDYDWAADEAAFDFPIETSLQIRTLDAAIALFVAPFPNKSPRLPFDHIVARSTYLAKLHEVTPHVQQAEGFQFVVTPLGWLEYLHRYFAAFDYATDGMRKLDQPLPDEVGRQAFLSILVILIASHACTLDYFLPQMVDTITKDVDFFEHAGADFSEDATSSRATDLAYAAQDFALCHEVAHIAAQDFTDPDEARADLLGLIAYYGSWSRRPALHLELGQNDPTRAAMGPIAFSCILRSLLCARVLVAQKLGDRVAASFAKPHRYSAIAQRSREIVIATLDYRAQFATGAQEENSAYGRLTGIFEGLLKFEMAFGEFLKAVPGAACHQAYDVAVRVEREARLEGEEAALTPLGTSAKDSSFDVRDGEK